MLHNLKYHAAVPSGPRALVTDGMTVSRVAEPYRAPVGTLRRDRLCPRVGVKSR